MEIFGLIVACIAIAVMAFKEYLAESKKPKMPKEWTDFVEFQERRNKDKDRNKK